MNRAGLLILSMFLPAMLFALAQLAGPVIAAQESSNPTPEFTKDNRLVRPKDYREWIYLSSGLGMTYGPAARAERAPMFDNVFVHPAFYRAFIKTGNWPDKTIFVLEVRSAESHGSINNGGHFQTGVVAVEAAVKDEKRFPEKWAYFSFDSPANREQAAALPKATCFDCHHKSAAVDNTFVQFYPTLDAALRKATFKNGLGVAPQKSEKIVDIVCQMTVDPKTAPRSLYKGISYYFCSERCKERFDKAPLSFIPAGK